VRPVRWLFPGAIWLVTNRCELEQILLFPSKRINELIGAWLARALKMFGDGIDLFGFIFLGNHLHLLLRDNKGQLPKFMWHFQTNLAKTINRELGRREGRLFARRYDAELVDGQDDLLHKYAYVLGNAVKAGLVERASDWPGLSSLGAALSGEPLVFEMLDRSAYHNATRRRKDVDVSKFVKKYELKIAVLPCWEGLSTETLKARTRELVSGFEQEQVSARLACGKGFLGRRAILEQKPTDRPRESAFAPRVYVLCRDRERRQELLRAWREVTGAYRESFGRFIEASAQKRSFWAEWPPWTCPPSSMKPMGYSWAA